MLLEFNNYRKKPIVIKAAVIGIVIDLFSAVKEYKKSIATSQRGERMK